MSENNFNYSYYYSMVLMILRIEFTSQKSQYIYNQISNITSILFKPIDITIILNIVLKLIVIYCHNKN